MRKSIFFLGTACALIAGCGEREEASTERMATMDVAESTATYEAAAPIAPPPPVAAPGDGGQSEALDHAGGPIPTGSNQMPAGMPQVAYTYAYGFRLPSDAIRPMQERHADLCEAKGPQVCRIISMNQAENEGDYAYGSLTLAVRSREARAFGKELAGTAQAADGELVSSSIEGEDLSKSIVDTEARLRARTVLRDRLMDVLQNRKGTVAELVAAERGVAQVNEEIDQAQSWLTEMRGRVAYSTMTVGYESGKPSAGGFIDPIRNAFNSLAGLFGNLIGVLIILLAVLGPLALLGWLAFRLWRRWGFSTGIGHDGWVPPKDAPAES